MRSMIVMSLALLLLSACAGATGAQLGDAHGQPEASMHDCPMMSEHGPMTGDEDGRRAQRGHGAEASEGAQGAAAMGARQCPMMHDAPDAAAPEAPADHQH